MKIIKYIPYIYIVLAVLFLFDGIEKLRAGEGTPFLSFLFAGASVFMFFFRKRFAKKMDDRYKNQQ